MITELSRLATAPATPATKLRSYGFTVPGFARDAGKGHTAAPHEIDLPHPAIEDLPEFVCRIASEGLQRGVRHYNGSICRHQGRTFMAYRFETFRAVSHVGICELDSDFHVIADVKLHPELPDLRTNIEDPHLASVGDRLYIIVANVVRDFPPTCRQRLFELSTAVLGALAEVKTTFGNVHGIEKNWTPFELPDGELGIMYKQRPRTVIRVHDSEGWTQPEPSVIPKDKFSGEASSLSCRTSPLRLSDDYYLEIVGGHVKLAGPRNRGTRYWFGAVLFEAKPPFKVVACTDKPLVWASEASPTIFNPLPGGGHPVCILPAGAMFDAEKRHIFVSCGVNDSYIAVLKFSVADILSKMPAFAG